MYVVFEFPIGGRSIALLPLALLLLLLLTLPASGDCLPGPCPNLCCCCSLLLGLLLQQLSLLAKLAGTFQLLAWTMIQARFAQKLLPGRLRVMV